MRTRTAALFLAALAAPALAQSSTSGTMLTWSLSWTESHGNNDGSLDPGESALLHLSISFTNQNTVANFSPPIGTFSSGTIRGLGSGFFDIHGSGDAHGQWNVDPNGNPPRGIRPEWDLAGRDGTPANSGADLLDIEPGQFPVNAAGINTTNPVIDIWTGSWTPSSFAERYVTFQLAPNPAAGQFVTSVMMKLSNSTAAGIFAPFSLGSVTIPISIPAPAAGVCLLCPALGVRRRSRPRR